MSRKLTAQLDVLLRLRTQDESRTRRGVAALAGEARRAKAQADRLSSLEGKYRSVLRNGDAPDAGVHRRAYRHLGEALRKQVQARAEMQQRLAAGREGLRKTIRRRRAMQTLIERIERRRARRESLRAARELDETFAMHQAAKRGEDAI